MTERITVKDLRPLVERMNRATGRPEGEADWTREDPCQLCKGSGEPPPVDWWKTPAGKGVMNGKPDWSTAEAYRRDPTRCPRCHGQGSRLTANVGRYVLDGAYGGWTVHRLMNIGGGVDTPVTYGHVPARELYGLIHAWLSGRESCDA